MKCDYPYEFYETCLALYSGEINPDISKDKDKISKLIKEMDLAFNIKLGKIKYGNDNRSFVADKENNQILPSLMSIKYMNHDVANILYEVAKNNKFDNFTDLYLYLKDIKGINKRHITTLISVGYFSQFGSIKKLERLVDLMENTFNKKTYNKEKCSLPILNIVKRFAQSGHEENKKTYRNIDFKALFKFLDDSIDNSEYSLVEILAKEYEYAGNILSEIPEGTVIGEMVARSYKKPWILFKSLKTGNEGWIKVNNAMNEIPKKESVVMLNNFGKEKGYGNRVNYTATIEYVIHEPTK